MCEIFQREIFIYFPKKRRLLTHQKVFYFIYSSVNKNLCKLRIDIKPCFKKLKRLSDATFKCKNKITSDFAHLRKMQSSIKAFEEYFLTFKVCSVICGLLIFEASAYTKNTKHRPACRLLLYKSYQHFIQTLAS